MFSHVGLEILMHQCDVSSLNKKHYRYAGGKTRWLIHGKSEWYFSSFSATSSAARSWPAWEDEATRAAL